MSAVVPKLKVPIQMGSTGLAVVEQDSVDEVAQCAYAVIATPRGSRIEEPEFGVEEAVFDQLPIDTEEWVAAVEEWEPRAEAETAQEIEEMTAAIRVEVGVRP